MPQHQRFDVAKLRDDMAARGWQPADLADRSGVARSTVSRFLNGDFQTARTAKKLAEALGYATAKRYVLRHDQVTA